jgi:eukaryotic-like serine/threonine-protein kinase
VLSCFTTAPSFRAAPATPLIRAQEIQAQESVQGMKTCPVCDTLFPDQHNTCPTDGAVLLGMRELEPGHVVRGKYRIVRKLGQGGMGTVYLAEHQMLGGQSALKFLSSAMSRDPQFVKRFRNEARAAYLLRHPNIVEVTDLDQDEEGSLFLAMEYVPGPSLRHAMQELRGPLPTGRAVEIARGIAAGLEAAHARGAVHRDIKPENILLGLGPAGSGQTGSGQFSPGQPSVVQPKVLDFGIAAMTANVTGHSQTHGLLLTPEYAAPEQWRGTPASELDGRTDLYALGGVMYEMLAGHKPFHAVNPEGWMYQHLQGVPEPLATHRPDLEAQYPGLTAIVMRLLEKDRERRPASAQALLAALEFKPAAAQAAPAAQIAPAVAAPVPATVEPAVESGTAPVAPAPQPILAPTQPEKNLQASPASASAVAPSASSSGSVLSGAADVSGVAYVAAADSGEPSADDAHGGNARVFSGLDTGLVSGMEPAPRAGASGVFVWAVSIPAVLGAGLLAWLLWPAAADPVFAPENAESPAVVISDETPGATIHYTVDGSTPTKDSPAYTQPLASLPNVAEVRAIAVAPFHVASSVITDWHYGPGATDSPQEIQGETLYSQTRYAEAKPFFEQACSGGDMGGCSRLGGLYYNGEGVARDYAQAANLYQKACNGGNALACVSLSGMYLSGKGVPRDPVKGKELLQQACDKGDKSSCH